MKYMLDLGVLGEVEVDAQYAFKPSRKGDPPEPAELDVTKVELQFNINDALTKFLDESQEFFLDVCDVEAEADIECEIREAA